jgi:hypothetical protein
MSVNIAIIFKNNQMLTEIALAHISIVLDNHSWTTFLLFKVVRVKDSGLTYNFNILRPESNFGEDFGHRVTRLSDLKCNIGCHTSPLRCIGIQMVPLVMTQGHDGTVKKSDIDA